MFGATFRRWAPAAAVGGLSLLLTSCSGGRYEPIPETGATLTGTVKFKGHPVTMGVVIAAGATGATGEIGDDGHYTIQNAPVGEVRLALNMGPARGKMMSAAAAKSKGGAVTVPKIPDIPGKYTDPGSSPLKTTVNKGQNTFDIVID